MKDGQMAIVMVAFCSFLLTGFSISNRKNGEFSSQAMRLKYLNPMISIFRSEYEFNSDSFPMCGF